MYCDWWWMQSDWFHRKINARRGARARAPCGWHLSSWIVKNEHQCWRQRHVYARTYFTRQFAHRCRCSRQAKRSSIVVAFFKLHLGNNCDECGNPYQRMQWTNAVSRTAQWLIPVLDLSKLTVKPNKPSIHLSTNRKFLYLFPCVKR